MLIHVTSLKTQQLISSGYGKLVHSHYCTPSRWYVFWSNYTFTLKLGISLHCHKKISLAQSYNELHWSALQRALISDGCWSVSWCPYSGQWIPRWETIWSIWNSAEFYQLLTDEICTVWWYIWVFSLPCIIKEKYLLKYHKNTLKYHPRSKVYIINSHFNSLFSNIQCTYMLSAVTLWFVWANLIAVLAL